MPSKLSPMSRAAMAVAASLLMVSFALAAKGGNGGHGGSGGSGGGEPTPPGTIFFWSGGVNTYAMDADGSNKRFVPGIHSPELAYTASSGVYGSDPQLDRLWLDCQFDGRTYDYLFNSAGEEAFDRPHVELYVVFSSASGDNSVQLTDFFGKIRVEGDPRWSSDGQDLFLSFYGADLTNGAFYEETDPDTGDSVTVINWDNVEFKLFRIHVSGAEIAARILAGTWTPIVDDRGGTDPYVEEICQLSSSPSRVPLVHWCPPGHRFVYVEDNSTWAPSPTYVVDLDDVDADTGQPGSTLLWVDPNVARTFQWSPLPFSDGEYRILFYNGNPDLGEKGIYTIKPDGTELTPVVLNGKNDAKVNGVWSPDNRYIAFEKAKGRVDSTYTLFRIPTPGTGSSGKAVALTSDLDPHDRQAPQAWVPDP